MKRMKKLFAILMTMAMVMGLGITGFAATNDSARITVQNANDAELQYLQIIAPNRETRTGWAFINGAGTYFQQAFANSDEQAIIDQLIANNNISEDLAYALSKVANNLTYEDMDNPQTVTSAGLYAIKATESGYTYNNMTAYVGFAELEDYEYPALDDANVIAKKTPTTVTKTVTETGSDKVVQIGDIVTYQIETTVPYIDPNADADSKKFYVYDDIGDGAEYYLTGAGSTATVTVGDETVENPNFDTSKATGHDLVIDLSSYITSDNANAGKKVVVTYTAQIVKVDNITNTAGSHFGGSDSDFKPVTALYTGEIILTKYNKNRTEELAGAEFNVKLQGTNVALTFDAAVDDNGMNVYTYNPKGSVTTLVTGSAGTLKVQGLDLGTYVFEETKAPEGYSKSPTTASATLELEEGESSASELVTTNTEMLNDKLASLPETGGMGTTLFTIAGCVIMISAAGLFFATRKKAN